MNLQTVSKMNSAAQAAFQTFSKRERYRANTPVQRFHQELQSSFGDVKLEELMDMFKALEKQNVGSLVISRKPYQTRFKWGYSLRDIARVASGELSLEDAQKVNSPQKTRAVGKRPQIERPKNAPAPAPTADVIIIQNGQALTINLTPEQEKLFNATMSIFQKNA